MAKPVFDIGIFLIGCLGAVAPEIVRLYNLRNNATFKWSSFYIYISILFAMLGGVIAWILPTTTYYGAFYAGVTAPITVTAMFKNKKILPNNKGKWQNSANNIRKKSQESKDRDDTPGLNALPRSISASYLDSFLDSLNLATLKFKELFYDFINAL